MSALRDTEGKLNWVLLFEHFPLALKELCRAREFGARHYTKDGKDGATNWRDSINGPEHDKFYKGCIRGNISHNLKPLWGEDRDAVQDNVHHLAFGALNDLMALEYALAKEHKKDDIRITFASPVKGITSYSNSPLTLKVETVPNSGEFESWDKIIADKIDVLYQWPEDEQYIYAVFSPSGEIYYVSLEPKIEDEKIFIMNGSLNNPNTMAPMELRPHWKVSVRKRPAKKTIYDWSKIPPEFKWCATDCIGASYAYSIKPEIHRNEPRWVLVSGKECLLHQAPYQCDNWEDSLEARPT